jgi:hypothetical protein
MPSSSLSPPWPHLLGQETEINGPFEFKHTVELEGLKKGRGRREEGRKRGREKASLNRE